MPRKKAAPTPTRLLLRGLVLIAAFAAAGVFVRALEGGGFLDREWVDTFIVTHGVVGEVVFVAVGALFTAVGLPRQVVCFLGGYGFGLVTGTALALGATVAGCAIAFLFARLAARDLLTGRLSSRVRKADAVFAERTFLVVLIIRLLPVGSNLITNLVAGLSSAALWPFLGASALGHLPQTVVFTLIGSGINVDPGTRITLGVVLFILSMLMGMFLYFRLRKDARMKAIIDLTGNGNGQGAPAAADASRVAD